MRWKIKPGGYETSLGAWPMASFVDEGGKRLAWSPSVFSGAERWRVAGTWPAGAKRLVMSQPDFPGWRARLNGAATDLEKWDGLFQSLKRPAGAADGSVFALDLRFVPTGWPLWLAATALCWALWLERVRTPA